MMTSFPKAERTRRLLKILWFALFGSQILLIYLISALPSPAGLGASTPWFSTDPAHVPFYGVAVAVLLTGLLLPRFIFKNSLKRAREGLPPESLDPQAAATWIQMMQAASPEDRALMALYVPFLLRLALVEAVALFGFVVAQTAQSAPLAVPFFAASLGVFVMNFPKEDKVDKWIESETL